MKYDEIMQFMKWKGYTITEEVEVLAGQLADCVDAGEPDISWVLKWLEEKSKTYPAEVSEVGLNDLSKWHLDPISGNITHESGKFFSIIGVKVNGAKGREVQSWEQPMIKQQECGILGILCQRQNGIKKYLLYGKYEPGNNPIIQLSPTLQATASNLSRAHGGNKPRFSEYFENNGKGKVLVSVEGVEDGGRFYLKTNRNMIVEVEEKENIDAPEDYIWLTLPQIKRLSREKDRVVNSLVRSILGSL